MKKMKDNTSKQRKKQLEICLEKLSNRKQVIFGGDMNWIDPTSSNEENDGWMSLTSNWKDGWIEKYGVDYQKEHPGYTLDGVLNPMLANKCRNRLDRILLKSDHYNIKVKSIELIGTEPIDGLTYVKDMDNLIQVPVLPSQHFGLFAVLEMK